MALMDKSLIDLLKSRDEGIRDDAVERIASAIDDEMARELLALAGSEEHEDTRADAVIALGPAVELAGDEYGFLDEDGDPDAFTQPPLTRAGFQHVVERLRALYEDVSQPTIVRRRAFEVLVRDPQPWHREAVRSLAQSGERDWMLTAIFAMGQMAGFAAEILEAVKTQQGDSLLEAVRAAGRQGVLEAAPKIRDLARSEETELELRIAAILALPEVDRASGEILDALLDHSDAEIVAAAGEALDELELYSGFEDEELDDDEEK